MRCAHFVNVCLIEAAFSECLDGCCKGCVKSFYFIIYCKKKGIKKKEKKISEIIKVLAVAARLVQAQ